MKNLLFFLLMPFGIIAWFLYQRRPRLSPATEPTAKGISSVQNNDVPFQDIFMAYGTKYDIDWRLIAAHASVESSFNPKAVKNEGDGKRSAGLMQILLPLSRNVGAKMQHDKGQIPEWDNLDERKIFEPDYNVMLGASLIRANLNSYGLDGAISKYNSATAGNYPPFANQGYVDHVKSVYQKLMEKAA